MSGLPKGWTVQLCGETFQQVSTTNIKVKNKETLSSGLYPVIDQGASKVAGYINDADKVIKVKSPVCIFGDHTRIIKWIDFDFVPGADGTKILAPNSYLNERFFYHQLRSLEILDRGYSRHFKYLKESSFKVAPLNEQIRIADKLDSMLAKVDTAQARLDKIPNILKRFRQSVLAAATSGELTKEWREINSTTELWVDTTLGNLCTESFYGPRFSKNDYSDVGIPTVRTTDMTSSGVIEITDKTPKVNCPENKIELFKIQKDDLLITRTGSIGTMAIFKGDYLAIPSAYLIRFRFSTDAVIEYLYYFLTSPIGKMQLGLGTTSVAQPNINAQTIKSIELKLPSLVEQKEIVRRVESLFTMADTVEKQYKEAQARTNRLTQSILAKAFRGELIPQGLTDEPAEKLLEKIKLEHLKENPITGKKKVADKSKKVVNLIKADSKKTPIKDQLSAAVEVNLTDEKIEPEHLKEDPISGEKDSAAEPKKEVNLSKADGKKAHIKDEIGTAVEVDLTDEKTRMKNWLGTNAPYAESAIQKLKGATFSTEQFQSVTGFDKTYEELKTLILSLVKGFPGISEPLIEIVDWEEKTGEYNFKLKDLK